MHYGAPDRSRISRGARKTRSRTGSFDGHCVEEEAKITALREDRLLVWGAKLHHFISSAREVTTGSVQTKRFCFNWDLTSKLLKIKVKIKIKVVGEDHCIEGGPTARVRCKTAPFHIVSKRSYNWLSSKRFCFNWELTSILLKIVTVRTVRWLFNSQDCDMLRIYLVSTWEQNVWVEGKERKWCAKEEEIVWEKKGKIWNIKKKKKAFLV